MNIKEFSQELQNIYNEMSTCFSDFQKNTGLHCLPGCGQCCLNPGVEASVLELIPLALKIYRENKLQEWLDILENSKLQSCIMYESHSPDGSKGKCGIYEQRPSLCRMFGVSGFYNKHQKPTLSVCKLIRDKNPELTNQREQEVSKLDTPMMIQWSYRLAQLDPALVQDRLPINEAFKKALEKVAFYALYQDLT